MKILHICAGWGETNGVAVAARLLAREQSARGDEVGFATWALPSALRRADEVWVHCGWLPCLWWAGLFARRLVRMPHACYDPARLAYHGGRKKLVSPIERLFLRRAERVVVTCDEERSWVERYLGSRRPPIEVTDMKRFYSFGKFQKKGQTCFLESSEQVHLLYLGRRHPLKGVELLEKAVRDLNHRNSGQASFPKFELRVVGDALGEEKERAWEWCDVLVLPSLSENFGLVVAEALERGKRVITTDGAPAWRGQEGVVYIEGFRDGSDERRVELLGEAILSLRDEVPGSLGPSQFRCVNG